MFPNTKMMICSRITIRYFATEVTHTVSYNWYTAQVNDKKVEYKALLLGSRSFQHLKLKKIPFSTSKFHADFEMFHFALKFTRKV